MNGAESLVHTLLAGGVDTCFVNPGTSEMHFVAALDRIPGLRCVLALFEGVASGAADGYARLAGKPAGTLFHCGPGLANALANLHNARRAHSPVVNIVGDQATYHRPLDPPLTADTAGWARGVGGFVRTATSAGGVGADAAAAITAARTPPGQVATLILPADTAWGEGGIAATPDPPPPTPRASAAAVAEAARALRSGEPAVLLLGGAAAGEAGLAAAARIRAATGARPLVETFVGRIPRGRGRPAIGRVPYPIDAALAAFAGVRHLVAVNAPPPVGFFAYPGKPGRLQPPDCAVHVLAGIGQDGPEALARLAEALRAPAAPPAAPRPLPEGPVRGAVGPEGVAAILARALPEDAIVVDESISYGRDLFASLAAAAPHDWLQLCGGAIGEGLPLATGAAIGAPGRRVIVLQGDGSAMYTLQSLWTQARERLDVTTILLANRKYAILLKEFAGVGAIPGPTAHGMMDLADPALDWPRLAGGMGVEAARAATLERFAELLDHANRRPGPFLIELMG